MRRSVITMVAISATVPAVLAPTAFAGLIGSGTCTPGPKANCTGLSAPGTNMRGKDLRGIRFVDADLRRADLRNANLSGATLVRANLAGARLNGANFSKAKILGAKITGVSAVRSSWQHATIGPAARPGKAANATGGSSISAALSGDFCGANFSYSSFLNVNANGSNFSYVSCGTAATFRYSTQRTSLFGDANMTGVNMTAAEVFGNQYVGTALAGSNWTSVTGSGSNFDTAQFGTDSLGAAPNFTGVFMTSCICPQGTEGTFNNGPCQ